MFLGDPETESIVMIGEIGGTAEEDACDFIKHSKVKKPIVGFIAGVTALRAVAWAMPAPSFPAARAPPATRSKP